AKINRADSMEVWGTGSPRREFLHVDDLADACLFTMRHYNDDVALNVGVGEDVTIKEMVELICDVVGFEGQLAFDTSKPDGTPRKKLDVSRLDALGWRAGIGLREGIVDSYDWYRQHGGALAAE
ncbi:MAG: NAD-dependent epimerase/dehydratase family protein, partial [Rhodospirillaceae bacterium]|nr:NAD-dependent epimerase/dehydratase family protein [Rhodospirillaceae bacterium]